jgi:hypothetical protein
MEIFKEVLSGNLNGSHELLQSVLDMADDINSTVDAFLIEKTRETDEKINTMFKQLDGVPLKVEQLHQTVTNRLKELKFENDLTKGELQRRQDDLQRSQDDLQRSQDDIQRSQEMSHKLTLTLSKYGTVTDLKKIAKHPTNEMIPVAFDKYPNVISFCPGIPSTYDDLWAIQGRIFPSGVKGIVMFAPCT